MRSISIHDRQCKCIDKQITLFYFSLLLVPLVYRSTHACQTGETIGIDWPGVPTQIARPGIDSPRKDDFGSPLLLMVIEQISCNVNLTRRRCRTEIVPNQGKSLPPRFYLYHVLRSTHLANYGGDKGTVLFKRVILKYFHHPVSET